MADMQINPEIYGAEKITAPEGKLGGIGAVPAEPQQVSMTSGMGGLSAVAEGKAAVQAAGREEAPILASVGAAMTQWSGVKAYEAVTGPSFAAEPGFNSAEFIKHVPMMLSVDDEKFLMQSRSVAEASYKLDHLKDRNQAQSVMGDNPLSSFITVLGDPAMFAVDAVGGGFGHAAALAGAGAKMTKVAAAVGTFGAAYGLGKLEQQVEPTSETAIVANAMLWAAMSGSLYKAGKLVKADPAFPDATLRPLAQQVEDAANGIIRHAEDHPDFVGPVQPFEGAVDNLTRPAVAPGGEGTPPLLYAQKHSRVDKDGNVIEVAEAHPDPELRTGNGNNSPLYRTTAELKAADDAWTGELRIDDAGRKIPLDKNGNDIDGFEFRGGSLRGFSRVESTLADDVAAHERAARVRSQVHISDDRIVTVNNAADIANHSPAVRSGNTRIAEDAKAVYIPSEDRVFLLADNIKPGDSVKGIVLHEYGVHLSAERVLGTTRFGKVLADLEDMALRGKSRAKQAFNDVPKDTPLHLIREEALGYYIERAVGRGADGIVSQMVAGVRGLLRKSGLTGMKYSEAEILQLVKKAAKQGNKGVSFDAAFPYVWHGGGVRGVDKLDTAYMGTGEGNATFGWGHYTSAEKATALDYRNKRAIERGLTPDDGGLYRIKINAERDQFIDLFSKDQSEKVAAAFRRLGVPEGMIGKRSYDYLAKQLGSQKAASEALYAEGIAGSRYATGRSRYLSEQSSNYVLFHNDVADMTARYSRPTMQQAAQTVAGKLAENIEWSLSKSLGKYSTFAGKVSELLVDNPLNMTQNSVASQKRAIRADLAVHQYAYEDALKEALAEHDKVGVLTRIMQPKKALEAQQRMEREVGNEMLRRNRLALDGMPITHTGVPPHIKAMADTLDNAAKVALAEMKRSGVKGADLIAEKSGYFSRRWDIARIEAVEGKLIAGGMAPAAAKQQITDMVGIAIQRATGWDVQVAQDVSHAILARARRKGYFEDNAFRRHEGLETAKEVRDVMEAAGIPPARVQAVLDILVAKADEEGKAQMLKNRVDMHMDESINLPDGSTASVADLIDMNMANITERYMDNVSAQAALARKGLTSTEAVDNLRTEFLKSVPHESAREEAAYLFDQTMNALRGLPVGERMESTMRNMSAVTQMVGLASSSLWQLSEYSSAMAKFGGARALASMLKEMPVARALFHTKDLAEAGHLRNVLTRNATEDMRLRPFIQRMEDNFHIPVSDTVTLALQQAKQLVPYVNAMKYVQGHQSRMVANLIVDTLQRGAKGDAKALDALTRYGLERHSMGGIQADIAAHGLDTAKWSAATWDTVRGPLTKMMDDSVLRARLGEVPAFAQFSQVGKFVFTFRSFVLAAHNKVLAGTLNRHGFAGMGLLLMYQMPLTLLSTQMNNTLGNKKDMDTNKLLATTFGQLGALGLFSELWGAVSGTKQQFGAPGTIGIDRLYKLGNAAGAALFGDGSAGKVGAAALNSVPLLGAFMPIRAIAESLKD